MATKKILNGNTIPFGLVLALVIAISGGVYNFANTEAIAQANTERVEKVEKCTDQLKSNDSLLIVTLMQLRFSDSIQTETMKEMKHAMDTIKNNVQQIKDFIE